MEQNNVERIDATGIDGIPTVRMCTHVCGAECGGEVPEAGLSHAEGTSLIIAAVGRNIAILLFIALSFIYPNVAVIVIPLLAPYASKWIYDQLKGKTNDQKNISADPGPGDPVKPGKPG